MTWSQRYDWTAETEKKPSNLNMWTRHKQTTTKKLYRTNSTLSFPPNIISTITQKFLDINVRAVNPKIKEKAKPKRAKNRRLSRLKLSPLILSQRICCLVYLCTRTHTHTHATRGRSDAGFCCPSPCHFPRACEILCLLYVCEPTCLFCSLLWNKLRSGWGAKWLISGTQIKIQLLQFEAT